MASVKLRDEGWLKEGEEGGERDLILVLSPLDRIKLQLYEKLTIGGGYGLIIKGRRRRILSLPGKPAFITCFVTREKGRDGREVGRMIRDARVHEFCEDTVTEVLYRELTRVRINEPRVLLLCPYTLGTELRNRRLTSLRERIRTILKKRLLALMVDEIHHLYSPRNKLGKLVQELAEAAPIAIGFSATPLRESFQLIGASLGDFLLGYPLYSEDLMKEAAKRVGKGEEDPVLIPGLKVVFYRTTHVLEEKLRGRELWQRWCSKRVEKYLEVLLKEFRKFFGVSLRSKAKILVLAPNIREAEVWYKLLKDRFKEVKVFVAHSELKSAQKTIEEFIESDSGVLVAVDMVKLGFDDPNLDALVIARPMRSPVAYVQARGRVLRWPTQDCPKRRKLAALVLHMAVDERRLARMLTNRYLIRRVESGQVSKEEARKGDFKGYGYGSVELKTKDVRVERLGEDNMLLPEAKRPREATAEKRVKMESAAGTRSTILGPKPGQLALASLVVERGRWRQGWLARVKVERGKYVKDEVCVICFSPDEGKIYVSFDARKCVECKCLGQFKQVLIECFDKLSGSAPVSRWVDCVLNQLPDLPSEKIANGGPAGRNSKASRSTRDRGN